MTRAKKASVTRGQVVAEARNWIGTPYVHQASVRGAGCDCLGLVRGVWRAVIGPEPVQPPPYSADWAEPQGDEALWRAALAHLRPAAGDRTPGQVLLFRMRAGSVAKHLGILSAPDAFIHAYSGHAVTESRLTTPWARRVVARFDFPTGD